MIYLACYPLGRTDVFVGDEDDLAEVRWVSLREAESCYLAFTAPFTFT